MYCNYPFEGKLPANCGSLGFTSCCPVDTVYIVLFSYYIVYYFAHCMMIMIMGIRYRYRYRYIYRYIQKYSDPVTQLEIATGSVPR